MQVSCLPLVHHVVWLPKQMSQCVVVYYDKELRASFKVTPPMLDGFAYGQSFLIVRRVSVVTLSWIQLTRPVRD
jgi:hypothetical protein